MSRLCRSKCQLVVRRFHNAKVWSSTFGCTWFRQVYTKLCGKHMSCTMGVGTVSAGGKPSWHSQTRAFRQGYRVLLSLAAQVTGQLSNKGIDGAERTEKALLSHHSMAGWIKSPSQLMETLMSYMCMGQPFTI